MNNEEEVGQIDSEESSPGAPASNNSESSGEANQVDQEMADEYGFTPQQAKAMGLYL
jgi:hypothetical protein